MASKDFLKFDRVAQAYGELSEPWIPTGDFQIEFWMSTASSAPADRILSSGDMDNGIQIFWDGTVDKVKIRNAVGGVLNYISIPNTLVKGEMHHIVFSRIGGVNTLSANGVGLTSGFALAVDHDITFIGASSNILSFWDGILSNLKLTDLTTPSNSLEFAINSDSYELSKNADVGVELWDNPTSLPVGWVDNGGGEYIADGSHPALMSDDSNIIEDNDIVVVTYEVFNYVSGGIRALIYSDNLVAIGRSRNGNGVFTEVLKVDSSTSSGNPTGAVKFQSYSDYDGGIRAISVRKISNALVYNNVIAEDISTYTYSTEYGWVGENLVTNSGFDGSAGWTLGAGWSIGNNKAIGADINGSSNLMATNINMKIGIKYLLSMNVNSVSGIGVQFAVFDGASGSSPIYNIANNYTWEYTALRNNDNFAVRGVGVGNSNAVIDNVTVREAIPIAFEYGLPYSGRGADLTSDQFDLTSGETYEVSFRYRANPYNTETAFRVFIRYSTGVEVDILPQDHEINKNIDVLGSFTVPSGVVRGALIANADSEGEAVFHIADAKIVPV